MTGATEQIYAKLAEPEREISNLRQGSLIVNRRDGDALSSTRL